jgi:hypothetical protein
MVKATRVAFLCSLVIVVQYATAADSPWAGAVEIKARWAPAIAVALHEFQAHQGTKTDQGEPVYGDLRHYTIEMIPRGEILSVTFAPGMGPQGLARSYVGRPNTVPDRSQLRRFSEDPQNRKNLLVSIDDVFYAATRTI